MFRRGTDDGFDFVKPSGSFFVFVVGCGERDVTRNEDAREGAELCAEDLCVHVDGAPKVGVQVEDSSAVAVRAVDVR